MGSEWGSSSPPKRKLIDLHDAGGLILLGIIAAPFVWMIVRAIVT